MIQYSLICENSHEFDAWFRSASAFDEQVEAGVVTCPVCAVSRVSKALMAPALTKKSNSSGPELAAGEVDGGGRESGKPGSGQSVALSSGHPDQARLRKVMRTLREKITTEADYVGENFATEARKIHENEAEARSIYGEATPEETASLLEDGIDILPLPILPEEQN